MPFAIRQRIFKIGGRRIISWARNGVQFESIGMFGWHISSAGLVCPQSLFYVQHLKNNFSFRCYLINCSLPQHWVVPSLFHTITNMRQFSSRMFLLLLLPLLERLLNKFQRIIYVSFWRGHTKVRMHFAFSEGTPRFLRHTHIDTDYWH